MRYWLTSHSYPIRAIVAIRNYPFGGIALAIISQYLQFLLVCMRLEESLRISLVPVFCRTDDGIARRLRLQKCIAAEASLLTVILQFHDTDVHIIH